MLFDLPLDQLRMYLPPREEPPDFDAFWRRTLEEARSHPLDPRFELVDAGLRLLEVYDVTFSGYAGQRVKGWLVLPRARHGKIPCMVEYIGYGGGRGKPTDHLMWASAGYAHMIMDTRGQGSIWSTGDTADPEPEGSNPHAPGFMTRGILKPDTYYYRRVFTDAIRILDGVRLHPAVDGERIAVTGGSQGGGIALAAAGLDTSVTAALPDVPFLSHFRVAVEITDADPYREISRFCQVHRTSIETVFRTLSYFDVVNFAPRARSRALFSVGLMDEVCPPRTVFAAFNHYAGPKEISVYHFNHHEGGQSFHDSEKLRFVNTLWQ
jgi:cephalosporin-C deacetylase